MALLVTRCKVIVDKGEKEIEINKKERKVKNVRSSSSQDKNKVYEKMIKNNYR